MERIAAEDGTGKPCTTVAGEWRGYPPRPIRKVRKTGNVCEDGRTTLQVLCKIQSIDSDKLSGIGRAVWDEGVG